MIQIKPTYVVHKVGINAADLSFQGLYNQYYLQTLQKVARNMSAIIIRVYTTSVQSINSLQQVLF